MAREYGEKYVESVNRVRRIPQLALDHVEQDCYGVTHAEVSAALLSKWEFPSSVVALVLHHHNDLHDHGASDVRFLRSMQIGEAFSNLHDNRAPQRYHALKRRLSFYGFHRAELCKNCLSEAAAKTVECSEVFNTPSPSTDELNAILRDVQNQESFEEDVPWAPCDDLAADDDPSNMDDDLSEPIQILVIDEDPALVKAVRLYVRDWGCRALWCHTLDEANQLVSSANVVLCESRVNGQSAANVVRRLRAEGHRQPVLVVTTDNRRETVLECLKAGVSDYLLKPITRVHLINKLRQHLRAAR
jgi:CheY-like chemotaxis protein